MAVVALLIEVHDRLSAGDCHVAVDHRAACDRDGMRHDVRVDHRRCADLQLPFDDQASGEASGNDRRRGMHFALPMRTLR